VGYPKLDPRQVMPDESADSALRRAAEIRRLKERMRPDEDKSEQLKEACRDFEAIFINKIWKQMRESVPKDGYLHSKEEGMYLSMFDWEMSRKMSSAGGIGLGDMLFEQLSQTLARAGSGTGGPPPRVPQGAPIHRNFEAASGVDRVTALGGAAVSGVDQSLMNQVDALARAIESRRSAAPEVPAQAAEAVAASRYAASALPRIEWPLSGQDASLNVAAAGAGIAMPAREGETVKAAMSGKVAFAGRMEGLGNTIIIDHPDGWQSVYANVADQHVAAGDVVRAGREIATIGKQERPDQPELHFQLRKNGRKLHPDELMQMLQDSRITGKTA